MNPPPMSSRWRKDLGIVAVILGFGVLLFVLFRFGSLRSASPQVELLIISLYVIGLALTVGGALLHQWPFGKG